MLKALTQREVKSGYYSSKLNRHIYTYEGFCYCLYHHLEEMIEEILQGDFIDWVKNGLGLVEIADDLEVYFTDRHTALSKVFRIFDHCPMRNSYDLEVLNRQYEAFMEKPIHIRYKGIGDDYFEEGDYYSAISWYNSSVSIQYTPEVGYNLGVSYLHLGQFAKGEKYFLEALKVKDMLEVRLSLANLYIKTKRYEKGIAILESSRHVYSHQGVWYYYGMVLERMERYEEALGAYVRSYEIEPTMKAYRQQILLEMHMGYMEQSKKHIEQAAIPNEEKQRLMAQWYLENNMEEAYEQSMEALVELFQNTNMVVEGRERKLYRLLLEFSTYYLEKQQVIKAIESIERIPESFTNNERVMYQRALISSKARNKIGFDKEIESLLNHYKTEIRHMINR